MKLPTPFENCHPDPELAEGEGPAFPSPFLICHPERSEGPAVRQQGKEISAETTA
jgi:hypothetical protein